jgi:hypothetical protein
MADVLDAVHEAIDHANGILSSSSKTNNTNETLSDAQKDQLRKCYLVVLMNRTVLLDKMAANACMERIEAALRLTCPLCAQPVDGMAASNAARPLPCGHMVHWICGLRAVNSNGVAACPTCQVPFCHRPGSINFASIDEEKAYKTLSYK